MELKTQALIALFLSAFVAVISFMDANWMWFVINVLCISVLLIPHTRDLGYYYNNRIVWMVMAAPVATLGLALLNLCLPISTVGFLDVTVYTYVASAIQAYQCFVIGFMVALVLDKSFGLTMTPMWMMIFAVTFSMTLSALDMFFTFMEMYLSGYPVFNEDFFHEEIYTNSILMAMPVTTSIVTLLLAIVVGRAVIGRSKSDFIIRPEVDA